MDLVHLTGARLLFKSDVEKALGLGVSGKCWVH